MSDSQHEHCPLCRNETPLVDFHCCNKCANSLSHVENAPLNPEQANDVTPLIPSSILEECSVAIANSSPEEVSCSFSKKKKETKLYYKSMNEWIEQMNDLNDVNDSNNIPTDENEANGCIRFATYFSFFLNLCLLIGKSIALTSSTSYTLISSLADSFLDLIAGTIISCTAAHSKFTREDLFKYPVGKSRVATVGILIFSVLMACCAMYIIIQCLMSLIAHEISPNPTTTAIRIMIGVIVVKLVMWISYDCLGHAFTSTLAEDHRNDVLTNALGLFMYWGGKKFGWYMDALGGILLSLFVLVNWVLNAKENATMLMGESAPPEVIRAITYVAAHHHPLIINVEQVIAFQVGPMYFSELHIVVPGHIPLEVAHWVGESLQLKVERIPQIERAWVHVDCESHSENEHLLFMRATGKLENKPIVESEVVIP